jgi:MoxR-like ATPase
MNKKERENAKKVLTAMGNPIEEPVGNELHEKLLDRVFEMRCEAYDLASEADFHMDCDEEMVSVRHALDVLADKIRHEQDNK